MQHCRVWSRYPPGLSDTVEPRRTNARDELPRAAGPRSPGSLRYGSACHLMPDPKQTCHTVRARERPAGPCPLRARSGGESESLAGIHGDYRACPDLGQNSSRGCGPQPSKLVMRVRFPSPAPPRNTRSGYVPRTRPSSRPCASTGFVPHTCHTRMPSRLTLAAFLLILRCLRGLLPYLADQLSECPRNRAVHPGARTCVHADRAERLPAAAHAADPRASWAPPRGPRAAVIPAAFSE